MIWATKKVYFRDSVKDIIWQKLESIFMIFPTWDDRGKAREEINSVTCFYVCLMHCCLNCFLIIELTLTERGDWQMCPDFPGLYEVGSGN